MPVSSEQVYEFIRENGPILPSAIADHFKISTLFASAYLSELSSKGLVEVSSIKVGGSPLYYVPEQRERLTEYKENLHEKEQRSFDMLKERGIIDDHELELVDRVAMRKMKDYAIPLNVSLGSETRLFWKFYTLTDEEASQNIRMLLQPPPAREPAQETPAEPTKTPVAESKEVVMEEPEQTRIQETPREQRVEEPSSQQPIEKYTIRTEKSTHDGLAKDPLGAKLTAYFAKKEISVLYAEIARKGKEVYGVVEVPSVIGELEYFFYAKEKSSITEKDVKEAYAESALLGYPLLYIAKGKIAKSATKLLDSKLKGCRIIEI